MQYTVKESVVKFFSAHVYSSYTMYAGRAAIRNTRVDPRKSFLKKKKKAGIMFVTMPLAINRNEKQVTEHESLSRFFVVGVDVA